MKQEDFKKELLNLQPGQAATLNYEMFELLFPPGPEDDGAKQTAYQLAQAHGCVIRHHPARREVNFVRE